MCPVCIATAAWIAVSATSTGGVSALFAKKLRGKNQKTATSTTNFDAGDSNEPSNPTTEENENPANRLPAGMGSGASAAAR
jgi:hypothetical protein